jgi:hypothetical protein
LIYIIYRTHLNNLSVTLPHSRSRGMLTRPVMRNTQSGLCAGVGLSAQQTPYTGLQ